jgi:molecular chaperone Hsp33
VTDRPIIANDDNAPPMDDGNAAPDHVQPFMIEGSGLRGRLVRLPAAVQQIISAHDYPEAIAKLLAEALCLTTLLAGMLKFDGVFTLQVKGNAVLRTLVCDLTHDGTLRGYVGFDTVALAATPNADFKTLTGGGYLAFTMDQANVPERYQGIVALDGDTLTECVRLYFEQSEQIRTAFITHVGRNEANQWTGGSIMLQQLAREGGTPEGRTMETLEDDWRRAMILMQTLQEKELLDAGLPLNTLLYRLFHEEGIRVFVPLDIRKGCRCSAQKIRPVLDGLSTEERLEISKDGVILVTCEFCNTSYSFPAE